MSSNTRVLHPATWVYLTSQPPNRFIRSPKVVKEAIMTDINDLVQEFRKTSRDGVGAAFFAMRHLFRILQECYDNLEVCLDILFPFLRLSSTLSLLIKMYRCPGPFLPPKIIQTLTTSCPNLRYCLMGIERCLISYFLIPKIWITCSDSYLAL